MKFGIDRLLSKAALRTPLHGKRVALLAHPASVTHHLTHSLDALVASGLNLTAAFGPQHGLRGDKQDNMVESDDFVDPQHRIPVFSLYGEVRRPTAAMMDTFDILLVDLQDVGCRIYTFATTLLYVLEAAAKHRKQVWVLDRPNPVGRPVENAGTVMIEGSTLSEGRGTTRPLELCGAPDIDARRILTTMHALAPRWLEGCALRECWFEPTFHESSGSSRKFGVGVETGGNSGSEPTVGSQ